VNLLITGRPGVGKTTVVEAVVAALPRTASGFFTRERRASGARRGFAIETLDGGTAVLADVGRRSGPRVGRYRVSLEDLDRIAVPAIVPRPGVTLVVIDEIGRMECLSRRFCAAVREALDAPIPVLATIARGGGGFISEVQGRRDVTVLEVTAQNRDGLPARIVALLGL